MATTMNIKRGDTHPRIAATLTDRDGTPRSLAGGDVVRFHMANAADGVLAVDAAATVVSAPAGQVSYQLLAADVDTTGDYAVEWLVTYVDGSKETFPTREADRLTLSIEAGAVPARDEDVMWVRQQTLGGEGWSDDEIKAECDAWLTLDEDGVTEIPDLWAVAAVVLERRLLLMVPDPRTGSSQVRVGDTAFSYGGPGASTVMLRSYIQRYWQRASADNREIGRPSGWRTVSVDARPTYRLRNVLFPEQVVN